MTGQWWGGTQAEAADRSVSPPEAIGLAITIALASDILVAYFLDRVGLRFPPWPMLVVAIASGIATWRAYRPHAPTDRAALAAWAAVVISSAAWLIWLARPGFLPLGTGPDLTHHLLLIDYIERHWQLVHDPSLARLMGEMAQYTPGSHLLAAFAGAWSGTDGLRALHALLSITVALKAGFVFLIAMRVVRSDAPRLQLSILAVVLALAAPAYALGAFTEFGFVAQVVAELFAVALWWTMTAWAASADTRLSFVFAILASAAFLTWPVYVGPAVVGFPLLIATMSPLTISARIRQLAVSCLLPAIVVGVYLIARLGWLRLAATGGFVPWPSIERFSIPLVAFGAIGLAAAAIRRDGRATFLFVGALAVQTVALFVLARRSGADRPYMALKMFYLLLWPMTACAAMGLGELWAAVRHALGRLRFFGRGPFQESLVAWLMVAAIVVSVARPLIKSPARLHPAVPAVSRPLYEAGRWARANLPSDCLEYLVGNDETAYWLHLAVLGNPRMAPRSADNSTYEPRDALVRWLTPGGLPYAIADLPSVPRDVRADFEIVRPFGTAAVVRRHGASSCGETR